MTDYRASDALCHWRHLMILAPEMNIAEIPTADHPAAWDDGIVDNLVAGIQRFTRNVITFSLGRCWMQTDIFVCPDVWTWGQPYAGFSPDGGIVSLEDAEEGAAAMGVRTLSYDTYMFYGPSNGFNPSGFGGLTFASPVPPPATAYYAICAAGNDDPSSTAEIVEVTVTHEWSHCIDYYFHVDGYGLEAAPIAHADYPGLYAHLNGDPIVGSLGFVRALLGGDIMDIATETQAGCTDEVWALGPVRKNYPR